MSTPIEGPADEVSVYPEDPAEAAVQMANATRSLRSRLSMATGEPAPDEPAGGAL